MPPKLAPNPIEVHFVLPGEAMPARPDLVIADHVGPIAMRELQATGLQIFCGHSGPEVDWGRFSGLDGELGSYRLGVGAKKEINRRCVDVLRLREMCW